MREVGIVGLGLIGGSVGMALRRLPRRVRVSGVCRSEDDARAAERLGAADSASSHLESLRDCDLILLATPIAEFRGAFETVGRLLPPSVLISDVASVKLPIIDLARRQLPSPGRFLGGHPMAGRTETGIAHSDPEMFSGTPWVFTPLPGQDLMPFQWWIDMVTSLGAKPVVMSAAEHDRQAAYVSHLAFTLSSAYAALARQQAGERIAGSGYRSMTRLAGGDPVMYADIATANRGNLLLAIDSFTQTLAGYRQAIAASGDLVELFSEARHAAD
ncbi:MAG TPA: prephenate dehydrogenase [Candidatus Dormibacteraeota bacterium]